MSPRTASRIGSALLLIGSLALVVMAIPSWRWAIPWRWFHEALPIWLLFALASTAGGLRLLYRADYDGTDWSPERPGQRFRTALLYSRANCPLCEEAEALLMDYSRFLPPLKIVDISTDPELTERHGLSIPVVEFDGEIRFRGRVSEILLRRLIRMTEPE
jgi:glutaredoxin